MVAVRTVFGRFEFMSCRLQINMLHNQKLELGPTSENLIFSINRGRGTGRFGYLRHEHASGCKSHLKSTPYLVEIISNKLNHGRKIWAFQLFFLARFDLAMPQVAEPFFVRLESERIQAPIRVENLWSCNPLCVTLSERLCDTL